MEFLLSPANIPFATAIAVVVAAAVIEVVSVMAGASVGHALDGILPDFHADAPGDALSVLGLGKAPAFVVLSTLVTAFGSIGYGLQAALAWAGLGPVSPWFASAAALALAVPVTGKVSRGIARLIPSDETYVGSRAKLVGSIGTLTLGAAKAELPAECRVPDGHGGYLYVQAVPVNPGDVIPEGSKVIVVRRDDHVFAVARFAE